VFGGFAHVAEFAYLHGMKIGYVHSRAFPAVDANVVQVVQMCRAFASLGHKVTLFIPRREEFSSDQAAMVQAHKLFGDRLGFDVVFVPRRKLFGRLEVLGSVRGTLRAIREHPQDLIYSRNPWSVAFLPRSGVPFIWEAHEERVNKRSRLLSGLLQRIIVRTSKKPQMVKLVAISEALAGVWEKYGVAREKLVAAHDAVDLQMFAKPLERSAARAQLGIAASKRVVVYTGALKADRGIEMILESARRISDAEFYVVGGSEMELAHWKGETEKLKLENVHFPGKVAHREIPLWLSAADVLLMMWTWRVPTIRVCSPMKLFEYMAARRVIVGPAFPTVLEVLEENRDAILFKPDDPGEMECALREGLRVCDDSTMPERALEKVSRDYTWEARCKKILESVKL
jgi:glycosyltransferase involved in cell wall biosynthesis